MFVTAGPSGPSARTGGGSRFKGIELDAEPPDGSTGICASGCHAVPPAAFVASRRGAQRMSSRFPGSGWPSGHARAICTALESTRMPVNRSPFVPPVPPPPGGFQKLCRASA